MQSISIREFTHNFSHYLKEVKAGQSITILERNNPVADIIPYNKSVRFPGWKRAIVRREIGGEPFAATVEKSRSEE